MVLVNALHDPIETPWEVRSLIAEAAAKLSNFHNLAVRHCSREANFVADWAAKAHCNSTLASNWASSPPGFLLDLLYSEAHATSFSGSLC